MGVINWLTGYCVFLLVVVWYLFRSREKQAQAALDAQRAYTSLRQSHTELTRCYDDLYETTFLQPATQLVRRICAGTPITDVKVIATTADGILFCIGNQQGMTPVDQATWQQNAPAAIVAARDEWLHEFGDQTDG